MKSRYLFFRKITQTTDVLDELKVHVTLDRIYLEGSVAAVKWIYPSFPVRLERLALILKFSAEAYDVGSRAVAGIEEGIEGGYSRG